MLADRQVANRAYEMPKPTQSSLRRRCVRALLSVCTALLTAAPCAAASRPNILLVLVDTLRADHLGAYGYGRRTSPFLDRLASQGTLFTRAYSVTSYTPPAVVALLTSTFPLLMGASARIPDAIPTLAGALADNGYRTAAFIGNRLIKADRGYSRGFSLYRAAPPRSKTDHSLEAIKVRAAAISEPALDWIHEAQRDTAQPGAPWFVYLHYMEPHEPYLPTDGSGAAFWRHPEASLAATREAMGRAAEAHFSDPLHQRLRLDGVQTEELVDLYDAAIADLDAALAHLLEGLGEETRRNTVICITADHGEEFGEHGGFQHAHSLFEELIHIPLLLVGPGIPGGRAARPVQITDIAPTLLHLAGVSSPATFIGHTLLPPAAEEGGPIVTRLGPESPLRLHQRALVDGNEKLIVGIRDTDLFLYDLGADPGEKHDLAAARPERAAQLVVELRSGIAKAERPASTTPGAEKVDDAVRERMRQLGYDF